MLTGWMCADAISQEMGRVRDGHMQCAIGAGDQSAR